MPCSLRVPTWAQKHGIWALSFWLHHLLGVSKAQLPHLHNMKNESPHRVAGGLHEFMCVEA